MIARARVQIPLGVLIQVLAISTWFATGAAIPSLTSDFGLSSDQKALMTAAVQAGFATGAILVGILRISDRISPRVILPLACLAASGLTLVPLIDDDNFALLVSSRAAVGLALAAVYPTGMRATISWADRRWRGPAVSTMVAALTLGTAAPYLLADSPVDDWRQVLAMTAGAAVLAALLSLALRTGVHTAPVRKTSLADLKRLLRHRIQRRITIAYVGHMWEVYGLWAWLPALLLSMSDLSGSNKQGTLAFLIIGCAGTIGCLLGGSLAVRYGKRVIARWSVAMSLACTLTTPFLGTMPIMLAFAILGIWGASVISDSALYSAMTGDESGRGAVGSALALQMGLGYFVSIGAIFLPPVLADTFGWQYAFLPLAAGPLLSLLALFPWEKFRKRTSPIRASAVSLPGREH